MLVTAARRIAPALATLALATLPAAATGQLLDWESKVDVSVVEDAALGEAEFLIHLAEQADLSGAYELPAKEEKGHYVYSSPPRPGGAAVGRHLEHGAVALGDDGPGHSGQRRGPGQRLGSGGHHRG